MAKLRDIEVPQDYLDAVAFEPLSIKEEFARLGADRAYWNEVYANQLRASLRARANLKTVRARAELEIRAAAKVAGEKITEAMVDAQATTHKDVLQAVEDEIEAEVERERMRGRLSALQDKKDGVISYGAQIREELKGDPYMREMAARDSHTVRVPDKS